MRKVLFFLAMMVAPFLAKAQGTAPEFSTEEAPVWYYIQFKAGSGVVSDKGEGNIMRTAEAVIDETGANQFALIGNKDNFYLMCRTGHYVTFADDAYKTSATAKESLKLIQHQNDAAYWEIQRPASGQCMNQYQGGGINRELHEWTPNDGNNPVQFITELPRSIAEVFSSEDNPIYYYIQFKTGNGLLNDEGEGSVMKTAEAAANTAGANQFALIGNKDNFYLKCRTGRYVTFADGAYKTSKTAKEALKLVQNGNDGIFWEIKRAASGQCMNQHAGAGVGRELHEYNQGDVNNPVQFVSEMPRPIPDIFSYEDAPTYFYVQFNSGNGVLSDLGNGNKLKTANIAKSDANQWMFVGAPGNFYMKSKKGNYVNYIGDAFTASNSTSVPLKIVATTNGSAEGCWEIQRVAADNKSMNQHQGAGIGRELHEWNANDGGNPVRMLVAAVVPPLFSIADGEENWYFVQFINKKTYLSGNGMTAVDIDHINANIWKLEGTIENFQLINKEGNYAAVANGKLVAQSEAYTPGFSLKETSVSNYPHKYEIRSNDAALSKAVITGADAGATLTLTSGNAVNCPVDFILENSVEYADYKISGIEGYTPANLATLWYTQPATTTGVSNTWMEYSLPIGNGQFGASLFGGVEKDEIQFNEKTLWSGGPNEYGYYLNFGSVYVEEISGELGYGSDKLVKDYYRQLDLSTATGTVSFKNVDKSVTYTREYIASNPDKCVAVRYGASKPGKISLRITMESGKPTVNASTTYKDGYAQFTGKLQTVSYNATVKVVPTNGKLSTTDEGVIVENADEVLLVLVGCTDFIGNNKSHVNGRAAQLPADNKAIADAVAEKGWEEVYADHVADHQEYFNRVSLELDGVKNDVPTNKLIDNYNAATGARNLMLEQLYYTYGRYLAIASSRGADSPANLQGIWNNSCTPPWHSDIHANINVQMNYWPVEAGNLSEMHLPFLNYIINEAAQPEWRGKAKEKGGKREDSWTILTENNIFGGFSYFAPDALINNAWYVTHLWQHYRYTLDEDFLMRAFPAMKGAAFFWVDRMVLNEKDDTYECPNEYSPEHGPGKENATAHAQQIVWESLDNTLKAVDVLDAVAKGLISQEDYELLKDRHAKTDRGLRTEVYDGGWNTDRIETGVNLLREWKTSTYKAGEWNHRHMSHLMALFPFSQLTADNKVLFDAAINSMKLRGDESTGWSMGWKINLWARALMPERSHAVLRKALKHSTSYGTNQGAGGIYYNLFDSHAPFQIDGNFGATSGVQEMLMQSHTEVINILPALPAEWTKGSIKGLKAVGNFTVDFNWNSGKVQQATIVSNAGAELKVRCTRGAMDIAKAMVTVDDVEVKISVDENGIATIPCEKGSKVVVDFTTESTGIEAIKADAKGGKIYMIDGREVTKMQPNTVYIVDGKKVMGK